ncbi:MAG TPA: rRNA maturation RNase YbeY [Vicinamibacterales bacterium]
MDPDSNRLEVSITDRLGRAVTAPGLASWLRHVAPASARGELSIALVSDRVIRTFNRTYRRTDRPTDVLSFRNNERDAPSTHLGDIVIATGVARRQAREAAHSYTTELKVLALHGLLHLLGYDHHDPADRGRMARVERALRLKGGLRAGLIERALTGRRR